MADVHVSPVTTYAGILAALLVLTAITVAVAFRNFGVLNDVIALGIALLKATLVVLYFMHVKYAGRLVKVVVIASFFWLALLFGLTISDYSTRDEYTWDAEPVQGSPTPAPQPHD